MGGDTPPNPAFFPIVPSLQFDTFVTAGTLNPSPLPSIIGGAVDLGGSPTAQLNTQAVNVAWYTNDANTGGDLTLARLSLSRDAQGSFSLILNNAGGDQFRWDGGVVRDGVMGAPEPSTLGLLGVLAVAVVAWITRARAVRLVPTRIVASNPA
jgi:hypothetical protein